MPDQAERRVEERKGKSLPVLCRLDKLLEDEADRYLARSGMADAVRYARILRAKLVAYVDHGQARIDNNLTEQVIRPCKLGAKNWLFVGSPQAGKTSAVTRSSKAAGAAASSRWPTWAKSSNACLP